MEAGESGREIPHDSRNCSGGGSHAYFKKSLVQISKLLLSAVYEVQSINNAVEYLDSPQRYVTVVLFGKN